MTPVARLLVGLPDVIKVYSGPAGALWELLMGEQIHVGGAVETELLARHAGIQASSAVLDVCSALGGPARQLAQSFGCSVIGLDGTPHMHREAGRRTRLAGLDSKVSFELGDALRMPFGADRFDVVWGQDAWCYVTDKRGLLEECERVVKPGGAVAFTDWLETGPMDDELRSLLNSFMVFPYMETLDGYAELAESAGLVVERREDLSEDFARHVQSYFDALREVHRPAILASYGREMYDEVERGIGMWRDASATGKVGRGRLVARKPQS